MPRTVRIYGMSRNLGVTPPPEPGVEVWLSNNESGYRQRLPRALDEWTRYFNFHSRQWIDKTYIQGSKWYKEHGQGRPIYMLKAWDDIPGSVAFPRETVQQYFATPKGPNQFFTFSGAWMTALAIMEGFERIEYWGFALRDQKRPKERYEYERPCFFYWVQQARDRGIEVVYQEEIAKLPFVAGDPDTYDGLLYGYATRPEADWDGPSGLWAFSKPELTHVNQS